jgi:hypothetical protein
MRKTSPALLRYLGALYGGGALIGCPDGQLLERLSTRNGETDRTEAELALTRLMQLHGPMVWHVEPDVGVGPASAIIANAARLAPSASLHRACSRLCAVIATEKVGSHRLVTRSVQSLTALIDAASIRFLRRSRANLPLSGPAGDLGYPLTAEGSRRFLERADRTGYGSLRPGQG